MKVIGAGLPRTATSTQMIAFEMLGFGPCYHMRNVLADLEAGVPPWREVFEGGRDWEAIFGDAQSTCDWPSAAYAAELADHYPEAKVVLTVREPSGWVRSMRETVWGIYFGGSIMNHLCEARYQVDPGWKGFIDLMKPMLWEGDAALSGDTFSDEGFIELFNRHTERVKADIPADRLLVWDPKEGWGPLCAFLEVDVPEEPLPHVNDTSAFKEGIIGGAIAAVNEWWDARDPASGALHGADHQQAAPAS
jgi:hypothetical protein